jgi:hypothetical protein
VIWSLEYYFSLGNFTLARASKGKEKGTCSWRMSGARMTQLQEVRKDENALGPACLSGSMTTKLAAVIRGF